MKEPLHFLAFVNKTVNMGPHNKNQDKVKTHVKNELAHHNAKSTASLPWSRFETLRKRQIQSKAMNGAVKAVTFLP